MRISGRRFSGLTFLAMAFHVGALLSGPAPAAMAAEGAMRLKQAVRLTWDAATRQEGIHALRRLLAADPAAVGPRLELGKVLTWERATRQEGIQLLRLLVREHPERADISEALAEVLTWDEATRAEGIARLRQVVRQQPERTSAKLVLAEVLSWSVDTRGEAEALYRDVLADHPSATKARLGLAQLLQWRGARAASRELYEQALEQDPADESARLGLAEMERSAGHSRTALKILAAMPASGVQQPEVHRRRARAYEDLNLPARALSEYQAVLAVRPDDTEARRRAGAARRRLEPVLEVGGSGSTESGDSRTSRLRYATVPITYRWHPAGDLEAQLLAEAGRFRNDNGTTRRTTLGAGMDLPLGAHHRFRAKINGHSFEEARSEITGSAEWRVTPLDRLSFRLGFSRSLLLDSRLSATGEQIGTVFYGPVLSNRVSAGVSIRPGHDWDLFLRGASDSIDGKSVADNDRLAVFAGFGRSLHIGSLWLRPGYALTWLAYDLDLGGFPPTDLGGDGVNTRGVGGYFSPFRFLNQMLRLDASWPAGGKVRFRGGGGIGLQQIEDTSEGDFGRTTTSSDVYLGLRWQVGTTLALDWQINYQDVASAFDRTRVRLSLLWNF